MTNEHVDVSAQETPATSDNDLNRIKALPPVHPPGQRSFSEPVIVPLMSREKRQRDCG